MTAYFQSVFNVRRDEVVPVLLAALFFFCILTALMVLRPARDARSMQRGIDTRPFSPNSNALVRSFSY